MYGNAPIANKLFDAIDRRKNTVDSDAFAAAFQEIDLDDFFEERKAHYSKEAMEQVATLKDASIVAQVPDMDTLKDMVIDHVAAYEHNRK